MLTILAREAWEEGRWDTSANGLTTLSVIRNAIQISYGYVNSQHWIEHLQTPV